MNFIPSRMTFRGALRFIFQQMYL